MRDDAHVGIVFVSVQHPPLLYSNIVRVLSNQYVVLELPVLRTITRTRHASFIWKFVPW